MWCVYLFYSYCSGVTSQWRENFYNPIQMIIISWCSHYVTVIKMIAVAACWYWLTFYCVDTTDNPSDTSVVMSVECMFCCVVVEFLMIVQPLLNQNIHDRHSYFEGNSVAAHSLFVVIIFIDSDLLHFSNWVCFTDFDWNERSEEQQECSLDQVENTI